jgi:hypothetical protein
VKSPFELDRPVYVCRAKERNSRYGYLPYMVLCENNGDGTFSKVTSERVGTDEGSSYGAAWGDYDRDGDLDLHVVRFAGEKVNNALYRNNGSRNHWINIKCIGTHSNTSAIGAEVRMKATVSGNPFWQLREISA